MRMHASILVLYAMSIVAATVALSAGWWFLRGGATKPALLAMRAGMGVVAFLFIAAIMLAVAA